MVIKFYLIRLNRYCMGRPTLCVPGTSYIDAYTDLSAVVVEGIGLHVEDILVSLVLSKIIFWTFMILTHQENQYSYVYKILGQFLSKALKQTKPGVTSQIISPLNLYPGRLCDLPESTPG